MGAFSLMFFLFNSELVFRFNSQNIQNFPAFCVFLNIANCVVMKIFLCLVVALAVLLEVCGRPTQSDEEVMLPREAWICHLCTRYSSQAWICTLCTREKRSMPQHDPFTTGPHDALDNLEDWYQNNKPVEVEKTATESTQKIETTTGKTNSTKGMGKEPKPTPPPYPILSGIVEPDVFSCARCVLVPNIPACIRCVR